MHLDTEENRVEVTEDWRHVQRSGGHEQRGGGREQRSGGHEQRDHLLSLLSSPLPQPV